MDTCADFWVWSFPPCANACGKVERTMKIAEWCFQRGLRPSKMQARIWNEFARKFSYDDVAARFLARIKAEDGLEHRTDVAIAFDLIDLREDRAERSER